MANMIGAKPKPRLCGAHLMWGKCASCRVQSERMADAYNTELDKAKGIVTDVNLSASQYTGEKRLSHRLTISLSNSRRHELAIPRGAGTLEVANSLQRLASKILNDSLNDAEPFFNSQEASRLRAWRDG